MSHVADLRPEYENQFDTICERSIPTGTLWYSHSDPPTRRQCKRISYQSRRKHSTSERRLDRMEWIDRDSEFVCLCGDLEQRDYLIASSVRWSHCLGEGIPVI
jgi:hypothetical protein